VKRQIKHLPFVVPFKAFVCTHFLEDRLHTQCFYKQMIRRWTSCDGISQPLLFLFLVYLSFLKHLGEKLVLGFFTVHCWTSPKFSCSYSTLVFGRGIHSHCRAQALRSVQMTARTVQFGQTTSFVSERNTFFGLVCVCTWIVASKFKCFSSLSPPSLRGRNSSRCTSMLTR
jgi:hypothetical protein